jgi:hypothetical protein
MIPFEVRIVEPDSQQLGDGNRRVRIVELVASGEPNARASWYFTGAPDN